MCQVYTHIEKTHTQSVKSSRCRDTVSQQSGREGIIQPGHPAAEGGVYEGVSWEGHAGLTTTDTQHTLSFHLKKTLNTS